MQAFGRTVTPLQAAILRGAGSTSDGGAEYQRGYDAGYGDACIPGVMAAPALALPAGWIYWTETDTADEVLFPTGQADGTILCPMCEGHILPGQQYGWLPTSAMIGEHVHLGCLLDTVQMGSAVLTLGSDPYGRGRHHTP